MTYSFYQLLLLFFGYSFIGWVWECTYCAIKSRTLVNRGFLRGPIIPIYGCGAVLMTLVTAPLKGLWVAIFFAGMLLCTLLEYVTGAVMEKIFKVRYWDYTQDPLNLNGYICLPVSLAWGVGTVLFARFVFEPVDHLLSMIPAVLVGRVTFVLSMIGMVDLTLSVKAAIDLRNILFQMEKAKHEVALLSRRLDVYIALAGEEWAERKEAVSAIGESISAKTAAITAGTRNRYEDLLESAEEKMAFLRKQMIERPSEALKNAAGEISEVGYRLVTMITEHKYFVGMKEFLVRLLLRSDPQITSQKYKEELEELREEMRRKKDSGKE